MAPVTQEARTGEGDQRACCAGSRGERRTSASLNMAQAAWTACLPPPSALVLPMNLCQSRAMNRLKTPDVSSNGADASASQRQAPSHRDGNPTAPAATAGTAPGTSAAAHTSASWTATDALDLDSGARLHGYTLAYNTYGTLNADRSNAVLICHALTGDQHVANDHPMTGKPGWWWRIVGPGRPIDTDRYFVICVNILGGCIGNTGPASTDPETDKPYGLAFPVITIGDMVKAQLRLLDHLGIAKLFAVVGGSMGGMQVLDFAARAPERTHCAIAIATAARHSSQNIAFHEVGRQAVMADPEWHGGLYMTATGEQPRKGLAVARMAAHITYLSDDALHRKFGRNLQDRTTIGFGFDPDFQVESYLHHQGFGFVDRFDANSYLYITRAMDYFDLAAEYNGKLANAFADTPVRFFLASFTSDWLYPTRESRRIVRALNAVAADVSFVEIASDKGHDAFLLDEPELVSSLQGFLDSGARLAEIEPAMETATSPTDAASLEASGR